MGAGYNAQNFSNQNSYGNNEKISLEGLHRFNDVIDGDDGDDDTLNLTLDHDAFFIDDVYSEYHSSLSLSSAAQGINSAARIIDMETINAGEGNDIVDLSSTNITPSSAVSINGEDSNDTLWDSDVFQFTATSASDAIELYYRGADQHTTTDLDLTNGVLTWSTEDSKSVLIDMSGTTNSSDLDDLSRLITFVEIL